MAYTCQANLVQGHHCAGENGKRLIRRCKPKNKAPKLSNETDVFYVDEKVINPLILHCLSDAS